MPLDHYAPCPCGSGKKLKFCCSDLVSDMERIQRMLSGDQTSACLEFIQKLEEKHPHRASLLGLQSLLQINLARFDEARATLLRFMEHHPGNVIALAGWAMLISETVGGRAAINPLQDALEAVEKDMPARVYEAIGSVGRQLLIDGEYLAARAHLLICATLGGAQDTRALELLIRVNGDSHVPLLMKDPPELAPAPADAPWLAEYNVALVESTHARWRQAAARLESICEQAPDSPVAWRNLGVLRCWLADRPGAVTAFRKCTALDMPLDEAVEIEALAQLLDDAQGEEVDVVSLEYPVIDVEKLDELLISDRRVDRTGEEPREFAEADTPAPRSLYFLLDRELPRTGVEIKREEIPNVLGRLLVFGRETDREPRVVLRTEDGEHLDEAKQKLVEFAGELIGKPQDKQVLSTMPKLRLQLSWQWRLPVDTPPELRKSLIEEQLRETLLEKWPDLKLAALGGKTVRELSAEPDGKIAALAAILLMDLSESSNTDVLDFNELREQLGLPLSLPVEVEGAKLKDIPAVRVPLLKLENATNDELVRLYRRVALVSAHAAIRHVCEEVVRRGGIEEHLPLAEAYRSLSRISGSLEEELKYIELGRSESVNAGESPVEWLMAELNVRIEEGNIEEVQRLVNQIQSQHIQEQGVAEALLQILYSAGLVDPNQISGGAAPAAPSAPAEQSGKLWTPGGPGVAPAGQPAKKQAIWTPD